MRFTPYQITIWLIDDVMLIFGCLPDDLILGFATGNWWTRTHVDYQPCIKSGPISQVR